MTVTETNEINISFRIYYGNGSLLNSSTFTDQTRSINFTSLTNNTYTFDVTVTDIANNIGSTETRTVIISTPLEDTIAPNINITNPAINNSNSSDNNLDVNYTASDNIGLAECWYSNDTYSVNITLVNCNNITNITWSNAIHNVTIYLNDSSGNKNSSTITFNITSISVNLTSNISSNVSTNVSSNISSNASLNITKTASKEQKSAPASTSDDLLLRQEISTQETPVTEQIPESQISKPEVIPTAIAEKNYKPLIIYGTIITIILVSILIVIYFLIKSLRKPETIIETPQTTIETPQPDLKL